MSFVDAWWNFGESSKSSGISRQWTIVTRKNIFQVCCASTADADCSRVIWSPVSIASHDTASVTLKTSVCHGSRSHVAGVRYVSLENV